MSGPAGDIVTVDPDTGEVLDTHPVLAPPQRNAATFGVLRDVVYLADVIANTEMVPEKLRGRPDAVAAVILAGFELGLGPMQSLGTINVIGGQPSLSPEGMRALVVSAGHRIDVDASDTEATAETHRREWPKDQWRSHTFTWADAERAELTTKQGSSWKKYPRAMLAARVTSEACRLDFPDVIRGVSYTTDEVADMAPASEAAPRSDREQVPANTRGPADHAAADRAAFETWRAGRNLAADAADAAAEAGGGSLRVRVANLSDADRAVFETWRAGRNLPWPPTSTAVIKTMVAELDRMATATR